MNIINLVNWIIEVLGRNKGCKKADQGNSIIRKQKGMVWALVLTGTIAVFAIVIAHYPNPHRLQNKSTERSLPKETPIQITDSSDHKNIPASSRLNEDELINTAYNSGPEVVELCIKKLNSPVFNMPDDNDFMRRIAYVMSDFGREMNGNGGIWQLSTIAFEDTMDTRAHYSLPRKYNQIWKAFGIDWTSVKYNDLKKPFYSALAARLYLSNFAEYIPHQINEQAEYWKFKYMRGKGNLLKFKEKVLEL